MLIRLLDEAAKAAFDQKNIEALKHLATLNYESELSEKVSVYIRQLTKQWG